MKRKKIAFFCPSLSWGGLEMNVLRIANRLHQNKSQIILYADSSSKLFNEAQKTDVQLIPYNSKNKLQDLINLFKLKKSLKNNDIDIIVFHLNRNFPLVALINMFSKRKIKTAYMQHMHAGAKKKDAIHNFIYKKLDCWIAPLHMFKKTINENTIIPETKITVIPFGIELDRFSQNSMSKVEARSILKLPQDKTIIGFIGRIDPKKCQHTLIETAHLLIKKKYNIEILFVGDKSKDEHDIYQKKIEKLVLQYDLKNKIHFRPHFDEIETAYKAIDIFCLTSASETFGMVTIEAMASGIPVVGTNAGGTSEIIEDQENGLLYEPEDAKDLSDKLEILLNDNEYADRLAKQAKIDVIAYSDIKQLENLQSLFESL